MTRSSVRRIFGAATMAVVFIFISGCGFGDRFPVHGKVAFGGAPVEDGAITFTSTGGGTVSASGPIKNGTYSIPAAQGPNVGTNRVEILVKKKTGRKVGTPGDAEVQMDEVAQIAPDKYNKSSTLTADIKNKDNEIDFTDLKP